MDLPIKPHNDTGGVQQQCFVRLIVQVPPAAAAGEPSAAHIDNTPHLFNSVLLTKPTIHHVALKANPTVTLPSLHSQKLLNDILHNNYNLIRLQLIAGDNTDLPQDQVTPDMILVDHHLDFAPLLHQASFTKTVQLKNNTLPPPQGKSAKKAPPKKGAKDADLGTEEKPLPEQCKITYSVKLVHSDSSSAAPQSLLPPAYATQGNFVNFSVGPVRYLPQRWLEPFLADETSDEQKLSLLKSHLFSYNVTFNLPFVENGLVTELPFSLPGGRLFQNQDASWDSLVIGFTKNLAFFLNPDTVHHWENMLFDKNNLNVSFSRSLNPDLVTDSSWEDFNEQKYRAEVQFVTDNTNGLSEFLEPGKTQHQFSDLPLMPPAPMEEAPEDEGNAKKKSAGKDKGVKIPKGLPQELTPEDPLKEGEQHPYIESQTSLDLLVSFDRPLIPLAQDRLKSKVKLSELIPKRKPIHKKISSTDTFKKQVSNIVNQLVQQYEQSSRANRSKSRPSDSSNRERFVFDLNTNGMFYSIKDSLKKAVIAIVQEKFASEQNKDPKQMQQFYNTVYVFLVEHIHEVLNDLYNSERGEGAGLEEDTSDSTSAEIQTLRRLAAESELEREYDTASKYYQQRIDLSPNSEVLWYEFALYNLRIHDEGKAEYCYRQCLGLNLTHTQSLLDYSILLMHQQKYKESQVLLNSLLDVDENNVNAWVVLSLLYEQMDVDEQARESLHHAKRLLQQQDGASISPLDIYLNVIHSILFTLHVDTVAEQLLLKVSADAPRQQSKHNPNEIHLLYGKMFMIRQDYERAEEQLKQALEKQYKYAEAWKLLGDVHFEQNRTAEAKQAYETSISVQPEGVAQDHVLFVRLGRLYLSLGEYESAKTMFVRATELWKSALTWMGLGASYYGCGMLDHAEQAMNEANVQNNRNVDVWAWLCVINAQKGQVKNAVQCRIQMERCSQGGRGDVFVNLKDVYLQKILSQVSSGSRSGGVNAEEFVDALQRALKGGSR